MTLADALLAKTFIEISDGAPTDAMQCAQEARAAVMRSGSAMQAAHTDFYLAWCFLLLGSLTDVIEHGDRALVVLRELGDDFYEHLALVGLGVASGLRGDRAEAIAQLQAGKDAANRLTNVALAATCDAWLGWVEYLVGDLDAAAAALDASLPYLIASPWAMPMLLDARAEIARQQGDVIEARGYVGQARLVAEQTNGQFAKGRSRLAVARQALFDGHLEDAEGAAHQALEHAELSGDAMARVEALELLAAVAAALESHFEAARLLGAATAARIRLDCPLPPVATPERARLLAVLEEHVGSAEVAAAMEEGDALSLDEGVAFVRRGRGERKRPSAGWPSLTPTELKVVELVADGLTNPEIAQRLFVARSTVKGHVSSILTKLGMSTRTELAAAAVRRGVKPPGP